MHSLFLRPLLGTQDDLSCPVPSNWTNSLMFIYLQGVLERHQPQPPLLSRSSRWTRTINWCFKWWPMRGMNFMESWPVIPTMIWTVSSHYVQFSSDWLDPPVSTPAFLMSLEAAHPRCILHKLIFLCASEMQNWSLDRSEMGTQAVLLPLNEMNLWSEPHSMDGAVVCELTTCISKWAWELLACERGWVMS